MVASVLNTILSIVFLIFVLIVVVYVAIAGTLGVLIGRSRGRTAVNGFLLGLVPIVGWVWVWFRPRGDSSGSRGWGRRGRSQDDALGIDSGSLPGDDDEAVFP